MDPTHLKRSREPAVGLGSPTIWPDSGYQHLDRRDIRRLRLTDDSLRHFYRRPELSPIETSGTKERALYADLMENPRTPVEETRLAGIEDPDAIENYSVALAFRDLLVANETLESAYLELVSGTAGQGPARAMVGLLTQLIVLHILAGHRDPYLYRAAELFFRTQKVSVDGGLLVADSAMLARRREPGAVTVLQLLIDEARGNPPEAKDDIPVLDADTAPSYAATSAGTACAGRGKADQATIVALGDFCQMRTKHRWQGGFAGAETVPGNAVHAVSTEPAGGCTPRRA